MLKREKSDYPAFLFLPFFVKKCLKYPMFKIETVLNRKDIGMAEITDINARSAGEFAETLADFVARLLAALAEYLEKNALYAPQLELAKWIKSGNGVDVYPIQGNSFAAFRAELDKANIPYLDIGNERELLIRNCDLEKCKEVNRKILITELNYFQDVNTREMESAIAGSEKINNKEMLTIHDLSKYDVEVIKNKCNNISAGFMVGVEKTADEKYCLTVHSSKVYDEKTADPEAKKHVTDFCKAYTQAMISLYGPNGFIKTAQIDADEAIDSAVEQLKGTDTVHYIVGADDNTKFIEINGKDFQYYETHFNEKGERVDRLLVRADVTDINYDSELQRCMDRIYNKAIISNLSELTEHLSTKERTVDSERPRRNEAQYRISIAESLITDKMDEMIKGRLIEEENIQSSYESFQYYQEEVAGIFECLERGEVREGYKQEDFETIAQIMVEADVDITDYQISVQQIREFEIDIHKARSLEKKKIKEVREEYGINSR